MKKIYRSLFFITLILYLNNSIAFNSFEKAKFDEKGSLMIGVARVDITPDYPIRLTGYGSRDLESEGVLQNLEAKAIAFGEDKNEISLFITVDLIGIPGHITAKLRDSLSHKIGLDPSRLVISSSHTHNGPETGILLNHFSETLPSDQIGRIVKYIDDLYNKLMEVSLKAIENRSRSFIYWGQGEVGFAVNRRVLDENRQWVGFGINPEGPVDHSMPLLKITDLDGNIKSIVINYACHGTTLGPDINKIHNDWIGEAQRLIEEEYPGAISLVSIGAAGDANPDPRDKIDYTKDHAKEILDEVNRLLSTSLSKLTQYPEIKYTEIELPYEKVPKIDDLIKQVNESGSKGYYAHLALDRIARGKNIPHSVVYPIQTWNFGNDLIMVFLGGEVVVDYALRLKRELDNQKLWVTAYSNDVSSYIASKRLMKEGGYEVESSMYSYNHPSKYSDEIEDLIIRTVYDLLEY